MNNQRGFVTLSLIVMSPILLTATFGFAWILWFLNSKHKLDNICYEHLLRSQEFLIKGNDQLLHLNKRALPLIQEKRRLNILIRTGPPPVRAAALAQRTVVVASQYQLRAQQLGILQRANSKSLATLQSLKMRIQQECLAIGRFWSQRSFGKALVRVFWKSSQISVRIYDIAPVYQLLPTYESQQAHKVEWGLPLRRLIPDWLARIVTPQRQWAGQCESHPHQGGLRWHSAIGTGRH